MFKNKPFRTISLIGLLLLTVLTGISTYNTVSAVTVHRTYAFNGKISSLALNNSAGDVQVKVGPQNEVKITKDASDSIKPVLKQGQLSLIHQHHFDFWRFLRFGGVGSNIVITLKPNQLTSFQLLTSAGDTSLNGLIIKKGFIRSSAGDISISHTKLMHTNIKTSAGDLNVNHSILGPNDHFRSSTGDNTFTNSKFIYVYRLTTTAGDNNVPSQSEHFDATKGTRIKSSAGDNTIE